MTTTSTPCLSGRDTRFPLNATKRILGGLGFSVAMTFVHLSATAQNVDLGSAANFAVLAGSTVANTGASVINGGNVGVYAGTAITGFPPGTIAAPYTMDAGDAAALAGQTALTTAYTAAAALAPTEDLSGQNLGGLILTPGVYFFSSSAQLTGTLTLNDMGNPNAQFVFQIDSTLTTAASSSVVTINDGGGSTPGATVFWQIGTEATLGANTALEGNILANQSITLGSDATVLDGRLLAENGPVTLDSDTITAPPVSNGGSGGGPGGAPVPDSGRALLLLGSGLATLFAFKRKFPVLAWQLQ